MSQVTPGFYHNVYFWAADANAAAKIAEGVATHLTRIPFLRLVVGTPAGTPRDVVDNSYGVALLVEFTDKAMYDYYETAPDHLAFIAECKQYWTRVQVYDTLAGTTYASGGGTSD